MPKLIWAILCSNSSVDQQTNNISLFQLIDQYTVPSAALADPNAFLGAPSQLVMMLRRDGGEYPKEDFTVVMEAIAPSGDVLISAEISAVFPENKRRLRVIGNNEGMPIRGDGTHLFRLTIKKGEKSEILGEVPVDIVGRDE